MIGTAPGPSFSFEVLIPGKTFLVGEYLALAGGPSVIVNTHPCFRYQWKIKYPGEGNIEHGFHPESPAGRFLCQLNGTSLLGSSDAVIDFFDPHLGKGGLGASTAEFLGSWTFEKWLKDFNHMNLRELWGFVEPLGNHLSEVVPLWNSDRVGSARFRDLLDSYKLFEHHGSGADLVSQATGGIAVWDSVSDKMRKFTWPFSDLSFALLKTGKKLQTHRYLSGPSQGASSSDFLQELREWANEAIQALAVSDADRFIAAVRGTGRALAAAGRVAPHTSAVLNELSEEASIRAAKGCGAMGSDVILILHDGSPRSVRYIAELQSRHGLELASTHADLYVPSLQLRSLQGMEVV
jgi:mevalonate kinase